MFVSGVNPSPRNYEIEGVILSLEVLPIPSGRTTAQMVVTVKSGESMMLPAPKFVDILDENGEPETIAVPGGTYDFPIKFGVGDMFAARSIIVPAVNSNTGESYNSKRYLFADPAKGEVSLENVPTLAEYLEFDYTNKP